MPVQVHQLYCHVCHIRFLRQTMQLRDWSHNRSWGWKSISCTVTSTTFSASNNSPIDPPLLKLTYLTCDAENRPRFLLIYVIFRSGPLPHCDRWLPWLFNTLRPRQNGRHFADETFKRIFLNENVRISIEISLKFVLKGPIHNIPALVQIMAWRRPGDKPLSEPMLISLPTHICVTLPQWVK